MSNKKLVQNYAERIWRHRDLNAIDEVIAEDIEIHSPLNITQGREQMREIIEKWHAAFPDLVVTWEDILEDGDKVIARWSAEGTHMGGFFDTSPTHREVGYSGVTTYQIKDGKIVKYWALVDMHTLLKQLQDYESVTEALD